MKVTVSGQVWLPLSELTEFHVENIKRDLTIFPRRTTDIQSKDDPPPIFLFEEDLENKRIGVPRCYYLNRSTVQHDEVLDVSYGHVMRDLETNFAAEGPYAEQETALRVLGASLEERKWGGVLLKGAPGFGKTIVSLEFARRLGRRTLILVHKDFLVRQWIRRIRGMMPDARIGVIKQSRCEFDELKRNGEAPDFVVGLLQSLSRDDGFKYPSRLYSAFGTVISDECHRVGAGTWSLIIPRFKAAWRIGVTATPRRKDGAQDVFFLHISQITYAAKSKMMKPKLRKIITDSELKPIRRGDYRVPVSGLNSAQIINQLVIDSFRTRAIVDDLAEAVVNGRKVMVVSERLEHLRAMARQLSTILFDVELPFVPVLDFYTGQWFSGETWPKTVRGKSGKILHRKGDPKLKNRTEEELEKAESANVIFATKQMVEEGLDIPPVDVLVMATPLSDIEQAVGRVQRWCLPEKGKCEVLCPWRAWQCEGKPSPVVVDVVDEQISQLMPKYQRRMRFYKRECVE